MCIRDSVFSDGELPDWVQQWEPTPKKADLLLLVAHPDDELIFFGGTIPTYAVEKNMNVVVAYMSYSNTTRRSEPVSYTHLIRVPVPLETTDCSSDVIKNAF